MPLIVTEVAHQGDDYGLDHTALDRLWRMEERHFWHHARNRWIAAALRRAGVVPPAALLEVGCGSGTVAAYLHGVGYRVTGIDTSEAQIRKAHERCPDVTFILGDVARLEAGPFDAIGYFDVLEHLTDPLALLAAGRRLARPGAVIAATVPALRSLHTVYDDLSGHKKRYERGELAALFQDAGLVDVDERGIFRAITPILRRSRGRLRDVDAASLTEPERAALWTESLRVPAAPVNLALRALCAIERAGFGRARDRAGATLLATGRVV